MSLWRLRPLRVGYANVSQAVDAANFSAVRLFNDDNNGRTLSVIGYFSSTSAAQLVNYVISQPGASATPARGLPYIAGNVPPPGALTSRVDAAIPAGAIPASAVSGAQGVLFAVRPLIMLPPQWAITLYGNAINTLINVTLFWQADDADVWDDVDRPYTRSPS